MKVLWFTPNPCSYQVPGKRKGYNGGGWTSSLEQELKKRPDIKLGVCFIMNGQSQKTVQEDVTYYPVPSHQKSKKNKILDLIHFRDVERDKILWAHYIEHFKKVIEDFQPDVIEIYGSELYMGLAAMASNRPTVLHIQGILSLSIYIYLPPGISPTQEIFQDWSLKNAYAHFHYRIYWKRSCYREQQVFKHIQHVIGRTEWDKAAASTLSPQAAYYYGGEILRPAFYEPHQRTLPHRLVIVTTSSSAMYKGFDFVLKIADILKNKIGLDFEWRVFGNINPAFFERRTGLNHKNLNISLCGVATAETLCDEISSCTVYMQPSYVENSPNSVCEAQILGIPVVATNVGGTASLIENGETGFLVPSGEPYFAAYKIQVLYEDKSLNINMGRKAQIAASKRHDKRTIVENLIEIYKKILG